MLLYVILSKNYLLWLQFLIYSFNIALQIMLQVLIHIVNLSLKSWTLRIDIQRRSLLLTARYCILPKMFRYC